MNTDNKREIKFRGKSTIDGKWIYGYFNCIGGYNYISNENGMNPVHPWSIGQLVELKDKSNKEIYEADIVLCFGGIKNKVVYMVGGFGYVINEDEDYAEFISFAGNHNFEWVANKSEHIEIIGNIYDNPELLK